MMIKHNYMKLSKTLSKFVFNGNSLGVKQALCSNLVTIYHWFGFIYIIVVVSNLLGGIEVRLQFNLRVTNIQSYIRRHIWIPTWDPHRAVYISLKDNKLGYHVTHIQTCTIGFPIYPFCSWGQLYKHKKRKQKVVKWNQLTLQWPTW